MYLLSSCSIRQVVCHLIVPSINMRACKELVVLENQPDFLDFTCCTPIYICREVNMHDSICQSVVISSKLTRVAAHLNRISDGLQECLCLCLQGTWSCARFCPICPKRVILLKKETQPTVPILDLRSISKACPNRLTWNQRGIVRGPFLDLVRTHWHSIVGTNTTDY